MFNAKLLNYGKLTAFFKLACFYRLFRQNDKQTESNALRYVFRQIC